MADSHVPDLVPWIPKVLATKPATPPVDGSAAEAAENLVLKRCWRDACAAARSSRVVAVLYVWFIRRSHASWLPIRTQFGAYGSMQH